MTARPAALQLGLFARDRAGAKHAAEIARLVPVIRRLARALGEVTTEDVRRDQGWLTSAGRDLAWLGALPEAAGLVKVGMRRSRLPGSNGNWQSVWALPAPDRDPTEA